MIRDEPLTSVGHPASPNRSIGAGTRSSAPRGASTSGWNVLTWWSRNAEGDCYPVMPESVRHVWYGAPHLEQPGLLESLAAEMATPVDLVHRRLSAGHELTVLRIGGPIAASGWASRGPTWIGEMSRAFTPPLGHAYVWDFVTHEQYRGRGLYSLLLAHALRELANRGVGPVWIAADWANWLSVGGITHAGFRPVAAAVTVRCGGFGITKLVCNPAAPSDQHAALRRGLRG